MVNLPVVLLSSFLLFSWESFSLEFLAMQDIYIRSTWKEALEVDVAGGPLTSGS